MRLGALETGGTKMVCAIGDEKGTIYEKVVIETRTPALLRTPDVLNAA